MTNPTATLPAPIVLAPVVPVACDTCSAKLGEMCDATCPAPTGVEFMTLEAPGDTESLTCVPECGNQAHLDGFYPVNSDGSPALELSDRWGNDGHLMCCGSCGRVVSDRPGVLISDTFRQVVGQLDTPVNADTIL